MPGPQLLTRRLSNSGACVLPRRETNVLIHETRIHTWTEKAQRNKHQGASTAAVTNCREAGKRHGSL